MDNDNLQSNFPTIHCLRETARELAQRSYQERHAADHERRLLDPTPNGLTPEKRRNLKHAYISRYREENFEVLLRENISLLRARKRSLEERQTLLQRENNELNLSYLKGVNMELWNLISILLPVCKIPDLNPHNFGSPAEGNTSLLSAIEQIATDSSDIAVKYAEEDKPPVQLLALPRLSEDVPKFFVENLTQNSRAA